MKKPHLAAALAALTLTPEALAQSEGRIHVSIERAFGVTYNSLTNSSERTVGSTTVTTESTSEWSSLNLLGTGVTGAVPGVGSFPWANLLPRLAVDYELSSHLTIGGAAFLTYSTVSSEGLTGSAFGFGLAPRVGYSLRITDKLAFWPRLGATLAYYSASPEDAGGGSVRVTQSTRYVPLWLNVEPSLVYSVDRHFAFTFGLVGDIPLLGGVTSKTTTSSGSATTTTERDSTLTQLILAAQFGVMGSF